MFFPSEELWKEGLRNLASRRTATALCGGIAFLAAATTVIVGQIDVNQRITRWQDFVRDGGYSYTVVASSAISPTECDAFRGTEEVRHSGMIRAIDRVWLRTQPDSPVYLVRVTPGLIGAMFPDERIPPTVGVVAGARTAASVGLTPGSTVAFGAEGTTTAERMVAVDHVASTSGRSETWDDAIVVVEPASGDDGTCIVEFEPTASAFALTLASNWFSARSLTLDPVVSAPREGVASLEAIGARPTVVAPVASGVIVLLVVCAQWWARRNEFVIYRLLGVARSRIWRVLVAETAVAAVLPATVAAAASTIAVLPFLSAASAAALGWDLLSFALVLTLIPFVGNLLLLRVHTADAIGGR